MDKGGEKRGIFIFQPISSCQMSRGRYFGVLNSHLEEFFGSQPPGGVHRGGGGGKDKLTFVIWPISLCKMFKSGLFGVLIPNLEEFLGSHPPEGVHRGGGREGEKMTFCYLANIIVQDV